MRSPDGLRSTSTPTPTPRPLRPLRRPLRRRDADRPLRELAAAYLRYRNDPEFVAELEHDLALRRPPSPIYDAERLSREGRRRAHPAQARGPEPHRRAQDQQHHRPGHAGQAHGQDPDHRRDRRRPARRRQRHGGRAAGLECVVYMGATDIERQKINVFRMKLLGATVVPVTSRLEDAQGRAQRGDARLGDQRRRHLLHHRHRRRPAPVPDDGARLQRRGRPRGARADARRVRPPARRLVACVGGGSNAIGLFHPFLNDRACAMVGAEAAGEGIASGRHAASLAPAARRAARQPHLRAVRRRRPDHRDPFGLGRPGLPRRRPRACLPQGQRPRQYVGITDDEAMEAFHLLARTEGILAALESSHAIAQAMKLARELPKDALVLCNLSGRGDKDWGFARGLASHASGRSLPPLSP
jgi:tryptophan synthase beta chain